MVHFSVLGNFSFLHTMLITVNINSYAYGALYNRVLDLTVEKKAVLDCDTLISVYLKIKQTNKEGGLFAYTATNHKRVGGYSLIRRATNLPLKTLQIYVPILVNEGLLSFESNGDVLVKGNNAVSAKYNNKSRNIRIDVYKKLSDTKLMVSYVRVVTAERRQLRRTTIKCSEIKSIEKSEINSEDLRQSLNTTAVLSNEGFYNLKKEIKDKKSSGYYFKRRLKLAGLIETKRNFQRIKQCTYEEYRGIKMASEYDRTLTYRYGWLVRETVSSFATTFKKTAQEIVNGLDKHILLADIFEEVEGRTYPLHKWRENQEIDSHNKTATGFSMWLLNHIETDLSKIF